MFKKNLTNDYTILTINNILFYFQFFILFNGNHKIKVGTTIIYHNLLWRIHKNIMILHIR